MTNNYLWIFCSVIDNYGDAGVALRLSRLLAKYFKISLWIDNLTILQKLEQKIILNENIQVIDKNITIIKLDNFDTELPYKLNKEIPIPNCVIELFSYNLPSSIIKIIRLYKPLWINLEYLSAEEWTLSYHLKNSPQASNVNKYFYFLGFKVNSGGLIIEDDYLKKKDKFLQNNSLSLNFIKENKLIYNKEAIKIFLFAYSNNNWINFIESLINLNIPIIIWIANHEIFLNIKNQYIKNEKLLKSYTIKNLIIQDVPFVEQTQFDNYLWLSNLIIARGEDSFVRALLTGKPFLWNIYPQKNNTHIIKLEAFLKLSKPYLSTDNYNCFYNLALKINNKNLQINNKKLFSNIKYIINQYDMLEKEFSQWSSDLISQKSAIEKLVNFIQNKLK